MKTSNMLAAIGNRKKANVFGLALFPTLFALGYSASAQQSAKIPRIGFLSGRGNPPTTFDPNTEAFRQGLRDLGYVEGKNIVIEYRGAEGKDDLIPDLVAELVHLKVDVLVSGTFPAIRS